MNQKSNTKKQSFGSSIYRSQNLQVRTIFETVPSPRKVLCVALDYAKTKHVAMICDGTGDILKKPFPVENSVAGIAFLVDEIQATCRRRKISREHVMVGGEDIPSYVENFISAVAKEGYLVVSVNAWEASENRENTLATTDNLDLLGIAKTMLSRRSRVACDPRAEGDPIYRQMRDVCRARRGMVRGRTAITNRIHTHVDRLLPGFLDSSKSGLSPFRTASLELMCDRFSGPQIARRRAASLARTLRGKHTHHPEESAAKLISLAQETLPPDPLHLASQQSSLRACVELYRCQENMSDQLRTEAAVLLASTPYAMLTSLPGISFVIAAGIAGELGCPSKLPRLDSLCAYSGIVPSLSQTGGPDRAPIVGHTSSRCNRILKDWVAQGSQKLTQYGPPEWQQRSARWEANGQHSLFSGARRLLRLVRTMTINQIPYISPEARHPNASREQKAADAEARWKALVYKWRVIPNWQEVAFSEERPLGFWRNLMIELHGADMPLPKK